MDRRLELHEELCSVLNMTEPDGDQHVYFQAPPSVFMKYPAIRYELDGFHTMRADNGAYLRFPRYSLTLIDTDPDSIYVDKLLDLHHCAFGRFYTADGLNHWTFTIY